MLWSTEAEEEYEVIHTWLKYTDGWTVKYLGRLHIVFDMEQILAMAIKGNVTKLCYYTDIMTV